MENNMEKDKLDVVSIRLVQDAPLLSNHAIKTPEDAVEVIGKYLCELDREVLCVLNLRSDGMPLSCNLVSMGAVDQSIAHPREIMKSAILSNATTMIMIHNHPSGNLKASKEDVICTDRMLKVCEIMGIPLVDSIIVGGNNKSYFSFREKEMLQFDHNRFETDYTKLEFPRIAVAEGDVQQQEQTPTVRHRHR